MLGDRIFAMGSDIANDTGRPVETIVDNRRLTTAGDSKLTINNSVYTAAAYGAGTQMVSDVSSPSGVSR